MLDKEKLTTLALAHSKHPDLLLIRSQPLRSNDAGSVAKVFKGPPLPSLIPTSSDSAGVPEFESRMIALREYPTVCCVE